MMFIKRFSLTGSVILAFSLSSGCGGSSDSSEDTQEPIDPFIPNGPSVISNFNGGTTDGWTVTNVDAATVSTDGNCGLVEVEPDPGFLCADANDSDGGTSYFIAPSQFRGDLNVYSSLSFDLVANGGSFFNSGFGFDGDVVISNGVSTASYIFPENGAPTSEWTTYQISLTDTESWVVDDGAALPTVLQSVSELRIRAEYGVGEDSAGLDDVALE